MMFRVGWDSRPVASLGLGADLEVGALAPVLADYLRQGGNLLDARDHAAALGQALSAVLGAGQRPRDPILLCAQSVEAHTPRAADDALAPTTLRREIADRLAHLPRIDLYWLAGVEAAADGLAEPEFRLRLREAFATLEVAVAQGYIGAYGLALARSELSAQVAVETAHDVLGERHHLRALKLPAPHIDPRAAAAAQASGLALIAEGAPASPDAAVTAAIVNASLLSAA